MKHPFHVAVVAHPTDVVHDLVVAVLAERPADPTTDVVECLVPTDALPEALSSLADPLHRVQDPLGVLDLVDGGRAFGAVPAPTGRVNRVALELGDPARLLVHPGQQAAVGLAVEAGGGNEAMGPPDLRGPSGGVQGLHVVPGLLGRIAGEPGGGSVSGHRAPDRGLGERDRLAGPHVGVFVGEQAV